MLAPAMITADELLTRLRDASDDAPTARLTAVLVDDVLARPVRELVEPSAVAAAARDVIRAWTASDDGVAKVVADIERARTLLGMHAGTLGEPLPAPLREGLRELVQLPLVARREAVLKLLDRPSFRQVLRGQLVGTLVDFGRKAASPVSDNALARGLGGLGKLAGQIARPSPLGAIASAVSGEVERQIEKRASDFADTAVAGILAGIADQASDPAKAAQQAAMRLELLEGLLALTGTDLSALAESGVGAQVAVVRKALTGWSTEPSFLETVEKPLALVMALEAERPLGELLAALGMRDAVGAHARVYVRKALAHLVATDAFGAWLREAMA